MALGLALDHPERIRSLTLVEPEARWILRETGTAADELAEDAAVLRAYAGRSISEDDLREFLVLAGLGAPETDFTQFPQWPTWVRNRQILSAISAAVDGHTDSLDRLAALDVPILAVRGTESTVVDRSVVADLVATAPDATLRELPGDHACLLQHPEQFRAALRDHLTRADRA